MQIKNINHQMTAMSQSLGNNQNNVLNSEPAFGSKFQKTKYLEDAFSTAKEMCNDAIKEASFNEDAFNFMHSIKAILNDGNDNIFKIQGKPGTEIAPGQARPQEIFLNNKPMPEYFETHLGLIYDGNQCIEGVKDLARKIRGDKKQKNLVELAQVDIFENKLEKLDAKVGRQKVLLSSHIDAESHGWGDKRILKEYNNLKSYENQYNTTILSYQRYVTNEMKKIKASLVELKKAILVE